MAAVVKGRRRGLLIHRAGIKPLSNDPFSEAVIVQIDKIRHEHGWYTAPRDKGIETFLLILPR